MLGALPTHAKKNWQEWVATLTHAYNCTVSSVTGFSPYFLMFGRTLKIQLDIEMGVALVEQENVSYQNYASLPVASWPPPQSTPYTVHDPNAPIL